ncbi:MAG: response regulator transcription factor [Oscillospiraceae bacterium]|jgi:DNA-binding response OmpR family regulator|nr:response regulator transcription factor [Oscillospiraceae bacterium]
MSNQKSVLVVEDNKQLNDINSRALRLEGYEVFSALTLAAARAYLETHTPDAIVLDILLPDGNGVDFCREIRERTAAPILFLTSVKGYEQTLEGLAAGGDDYLNKPFDINILIAKIAAFLRRDNIAERVKQPGKTLTRGSLTLDIMVNVAALNGADMLLSPKEFSLLLLFAQNDGKSMSAEYLYEKVWKAPMNDNDSAVKNMVYRLRKKLEGSGYTISASRNEGYSFEKSDR